MADAEESFNSNSEEVITDYTEKDEEKESIVMNNGELAYIGQDCDQIPPHLANSYGTVTTRLDLSYNKLRSLEGLNAFQILEELVLDNNELEDSFTMPKLPHLHTLSLNKNRICNLEHLIDKIENNLPSVTYLSLLGNLACPNQLSCEDKDEEDYQRYRHYVLFRLPNLKFLDSSPVRASERQDANRLGPFLKVVRPKDDVQNSEDSLSQSPLGYTPLPSDVREGAGRGGTFGVSKYVYYGRHSEGNRFIRNNDL